MSGSSDREILNIEEAAALLGVSIKTFNKVLHSEDMPARKIGREWKFSRRALIDWVGNGQNRDFYKDSGPTPSVGISSDGKARRTQGWRIESE
jgi:excisionase family DNA binding protein